MGRLTTHVLNTTTGRPAAGIRIDLWRIGASEQNIRTVRTNSDGRCDTPLLEGGEFEAGQYELVFHAGDYFANQGMDFPEPRFLDHVIIRFGVADTDQHYHVPLLVSPYAYSTYRGS